MFRGQMHIWGFSCPVKVCVSKASVMFLSMRLLTYFQLPLLYEDNGIKNLSHLCFFFQILLHMNFTCFHSWKHYSSQQFDDIGEVKSETSVIESENLCK